MAEGSHIDNYPSTFNRDIPITCVNIDNEKEESICAAIRAIFEEVGKHLNIKSLKGISITLGDEGYRHAIDLIDSNRQISNGEVIGCAITISNFVDGNLESHIVLKDVAIVPLLVDKASTDEEQIDFMFQVIAHECGHIHSDEVFYEAVGDIPTLKDCKSHYEELVYSISTVSWSEFFACYFSAHIGQCPENDFRDIVENKVKVISDELESFKYMDLEPLELLSRVYKNVGNLVKYSSYYIGWMFNNRVRPEKTKLHENLKDSWFLDYFLELDSIYENIELKLSSKEIKFDNILEIGYLSIKIAEHFGYSTSLDKDKGTGIFVMF